MLRPVDAMVFTAPAGKWAPTQELFVSHPSKSSGSDKPSFSKSCFEKPRPEAGYNSKHKPIRFCGTNLTIDLPAECHTTITHMYIIISCDSSLASQDDGTSHVAGPRAPQKNNRYEKCQCHVYSAACRSLDPQKSRQIILNLSFVRGPSVTRQLLMLF